VSFSKIDSPFLFFIMKILEKYELEDFKITQSEKDFDFNIWIPDNNYVVLGRSDNIEDALKKDVKDVDFFVVKRPSGGHTVLLSPKTVVISVLNRDMKIKSKDIFKEINAAIIDVLENLGVVNLKEQGISDIAIGEMKILGSSIYRNRDYYFYHAVLNYAETADMIEKLLKPPKHEPDYRKGRSHLEFVTSLKNEGYTFSVDELQLKLSEKFLEMVNVSNLA